MNSVWTDPRLLRALEATLEEPAHSDDESRKEFDTFDALFDAAQIEQRSRRQILLASVCVQMALIIGNEQEAQRLLLCLYETGMLAGMTAMNTYHESKLLEELTNDHQPHA